MHRLLFLHLLFLLILSGSSTGQDVHFSQFRMSPIFLNPATAGSFKGNFRAHLNYKNQWASIGNPYQTFSVSADGKLFKEKWERSHLGIGGTAYRDQAGDAGFGTTRAKVAVSYDLAVSDGQFLSAGLQLGYDQQSVNTDALKWGNQYDGTGHNPDLPSGERGLKKKSSAMDMGIGLDWSIFSENSNVVKTEGFWVEAGVALHHLTRPEHSLYKGGDAKVKSKFIGHLDASWGIPNTAMALLPGIMYTRQGPSREFLYGGKFRYQFKEESHFTGLNKGSALSIGLHRRMGDALIAGLTLEYAQFALGVSYDINTSKLKSATNRRGGFEVSLRFITPDPFTSGRPGGMPSF